MVIGLTGGIGSGKSTVARELRELGAVVVDADQVARAVVQRGSLVLEQLIEEFGSDIVDESGNLDRQKLAHIVFGSPKNVRRLNEITHPEILARIMREVETALGQDKIVVVDAPLLYEVGMEDEVDEVWVVDADEDKRVRRLQRRGVSESEAWERMRAQMALRDKVARADVVIDNNGGMEETRMQVREQWQRLVGKECG